MEKYWDDFDMEIQCEEAYYGFEDEVLEAMDLDELYDVGRFTEDVVDSLGRVYANLGMLHTYTTQELEAQEAKYKDIR